MDFLWWKVDSEKGLSQHLAKLQNWQNEKNRLILFYLRNFNDSVQEMSVQDYQLENIQKLKKKKRRSLSESVVVKQPETARIRRQSKVSCCPAMEYCLLKFATVNLKQSYHRFIDLHNSPFLLWLSLNFYCWLLLFIFKHHAILSVYREMVTLIYSGTLVNSIST